MWRHLAIADNSTASVSVLTRGSSSSELSVMVPRLLFLPSSINKEVTMQVDVEEEVKKPRARPSDPSFVTRIGWNISIDRKMVQVEEPIPMNISDSDPTGWEEKYHLMKDKDKDGLLAVGIPNPVQMRLILKHRNDPPVRPTKQYRWEEVIAFPDDLSDITDPCYDTTCCENPKYEGVIASFGYMYKDAPQEYVGSSVIMMYLRMKFPDSDPGRFNIPYRYYDNGWPNNESVQRWLLVPDGSSVNRVALDDNTVVPRRPQGSASAEKRRKRNAKRNKGKVLTSAKNLLFGTPMFDCRVEDKQCNCRELLHAPPHDVYSIREYYYIVEREWSRSMGDKFLASMLLPNGDSKWFYQVPCPSNTKVLLSLEEMLGQKLVRSYRVCRTQFMLLFNLCEQRMTNLALNRRWAVANPGVDTNPFRWVHVGSTGFFFMDPTSKLLAWRNEWWSLYKQKYWKPAGQRGRAVRFHTPGSHAQMPKKLPAVGTASTLTKEEEGETKDCDRWRNKDTLLPWNDNTALYQEGNFPPRPNSPSFGDKGLCMRGCDRADVSVDSDPGQPSQKCRQGTLRLVPRTYRKRKNQNEKRRYKREPVKQHDAFAKHAVYGQFP